MQFLNALVLCLHTLAGVVSRRLANSRHGIQRARTRVLLLSRRMKGGVTFRPPAASGHCQCRGPAGFTALPPTLDARTSQRERMVESTTQSEILSPERGVCCRRQTEPDVERQWEPRSLVLVLGSLEVAAERGQPFHKKSPKALPAGARSFAQVSYQPHSGPPAAQSLRPRRGRRDPKVSEATKKFCTARLPPSERSNRCSHHRQPSSPHALCGGDHPRDNKKKIEKK